MKKVTIWAFIMILLGCSETLQRDSVNPNANVTSIFFKTNADAVSSVNAVYNALIVDGFFNRMGAVYNDGMSDELTSRSPWDVLVTVSAFTMPSTSAGAPIVWGDCYTLIARANQTIEGVSAMTGIDPVLKDRVLGQAYFLRAFAYFHLSNYYKDVPLVLKVPVTPSDWYPTTSSQADVYAQVKADLAAAIPKLPVTYSGVTGPDAGQNQRVTSGAAHALLGKVNLYTQQWAAAKAEFDAVIASGKYSLATNFKDNFTETPGIEQSNPETIFSVVFTNDLSPDLNWGGVPSATWRQFSAIAPTYGARGFGFFDFFPTTFLYNEMKLEKTAALKTDPRLLATVISYEPADGFTKAYGKDYLTAPSAGAGYLANEIFIKKFTRCDLGISNETSSLNSGIDYPVIRYADVLLMNAEANSELGNAAAAATLIQQVRARAGLDDINTATAAHTPAFSAMTLAQRRDQIAHERIMEFAIEGSRRNDIIRWGWLNDPAKVALLKSHDIEWNTWKAGKEYVPVPQTDLDRNPNLSKNSAN